MKLLLVTMTALVAVVYADVSHLDNYHHPAPTVTHLANLTPKQTYNQPRSRVQIESIKSSVPLGSFTIHENIGQGHGIGSQGFSSVQASGAYNYNAPQQQPFHIGFQQQQESYNTHSGAPVHQTLSVPTTGPSERSYLPPAPQLQHYVAPVQQQTLSSLAPAVIQQTFHSPAVTEVQNSFSFPTPTAGHHQSYSAPAVSPVIQQSFSAHGPAAVQQTYYSSGAVQQQNHLSAGQIQEQSFKLSGHQQQAVTGIVSTNVEGNGAYNYQPHAQQQRFPAVVSNPIQQSFTAPAAGPIQQTYSVTANVHQHQQQQQQSFSTSANIESGPYNYQPAATTSQHPSYSGRTAASVQHSFFVPAATHSVTSSSADETDSLNRQPTAQVQQQHIEPVQQTLSVPTATPVQLSGLTEPIGVGVDTGSLNYQTAASVTSISPISVPQAVEYSVPGPQKINFPTPESELTAPAATHEVGTVYGANGGYVYSKFI